METWFFPEDAQLYLHKLDNQGLHFPANDPTEVQFGKSVRRHIEPFTDVICSTDYRGKIYVSWTDSRLANESDLWIMQYS